MRRVRYRLGCLRRARRKRAHIMYILSLMYEPLERFVYFNNDWRFFFGCDKEYKLNRLSGGR